MYGYSPWRQETMLIIASLLALAVMGSLVDQSLLFVMLGLAGWLTWYIVQMKKLLQWMERSNKKLPEDTPGMWGYVYYRLLAQEKKSKSRKKKIRRILKEFSSSTRAMPDATVVLNDRYEIQWVNEAATRTLGLRRNDTGQLITDLLRQPEFREWIYQNEMQDDYVNRSPINPNISLMMRAVPYGNQQYLVVARDITERLRLDQMRQDFIANASHELRTPLSVMQGSLEMLESKLQNDDSVEKPMQWMRKQSERMQSILEDLLTLARLEAYRPERADLREVNVAELIKLITEEARFLSNKNGGHEWTVRIEDTPMVWGNLEHFRILISNLVFNAVRYTPAGGKIKVIWERRVNSLHFSVIDSGPGIPLRDVPRLTERFYRVDVGRSRESGGTGLGLAIVKHILDIYQSRLEVWSQIGKGSQFGFGLSLEYVVSQNNSAHESNPEKPAERVKSL